MLTTRASQPAHVIMFFEGGYDQALDMSSHSTDIPYRIPKSTYLK